MLSLIINLVIGMNTTHYAIDDRLSYVIGFIIAILMPNFIINSNDLGPMLDFLIEILGKVILGGGGAIGVYFTNKVLKYYEMKRKKKKQI